jgi:ArsR family transcriptional regulator
MDATRLEATLRLSALCDALGHPARVAVVEHLIARRGASTLGELCDVLPLAQSTVSQHVGVLVRAGLLRAERRAPRTLYRMDEAGLAELRGRIMGL